MKENSIRELTAEEVGEVSGGDRRFETGSLALAGAAGIAKAVGGGLLAVSSAPVLATVAIAGLTAYGAYAVTSYAI